MAGMIVRKPRPIATLEPILKQIRSGRGDRGDCEKAWTLPLADLPPAHVLLVATPATRGVYCYVYLPGDEPNARALHPRLRYGDRFSVLHETLYALWGQQEVLSRTPSGRYRYLPMLLGDGEPYRLGGATVVSGAGRYHGDLVCQQLAALAELPHSLAIRPQRLNSVGHRYYQLSQLMGSLDD